MNDSLLRLLIVDDEENTRNLIKLCIDWRELGIQILGDCASGMEALDYLENHPVDIIVSDIRMPYMDGLEFSSIAIKRYPGVKIIVLTAYEEFEYAKKGINVGISDFLLKPIKRVELRDAILTLKNKIEVERVNRDEYVKMKKELLDSFEYLKEKFLNDMLQKSYSPDEIKEKLVYFSVESLLNHIQVALIDIYKFNSDEEESVFLDLECVEIVKKYFKDFSMINIFIDNSRKIVILNSNPSIDVIQSCEHIKNLIINSLNSWVSIGIGNMYSDLRSIKQAYKEAYEALKYKVVYGKNHVVCFNDLSINSQSSDIKIDEIDEIGFYVKAGIDEKVIGIIDRIYKDLSSVGNYNIEKIRVISINIVTMVLNAITEVGLNYNDIMESKSLPYNDVLKIDTIPEMREYLEKFVISVIKVINCARDKKTNKTLTDIIEYIQKNLSNSELSLSSVAREFYLNPSYLSRIFKQETNQTFVEYLTKVRIEKAIKLFKETDLKSYEIAQEVGIPDPNYFGKCFKKYTGICANHYRKLQ